MTTPKPPLKPGTRSGKYPLAPPQTTQDAQRQIAALLRKNAEAMKALA